MTETDARAERLPRLTRRGFLKTSALATAGAMLPAACSTLGGSAKAKRPNLILFFTDDQSWDSVGYMNPIVQTPTLDRLAKGGAIFEQGHCNTIPCVPSRASLMSGVHHHRWERGPRMGLGRGLKEGAWTMMHALRAAGYRTGMIGKSHFQPVRAKHGFEVMEVVDPGTRWGKEPPGSTYKSDYDRWLDEKGARDRWAKMKVPKRGGYSTFPWQFEPELHRITWQTDRVRKFIEAQKDDDRPFALIVTYYAPHTPYEPLKKFKDLYDPEKMPYATDEWDCVEDAPQSFNDLPKTERWPKRFHKRQMQDLTAAYWGLCSQIDDSVAKILEKVDLDNTLAVYTSDHGDYLGKRNRMFKFPSMGMEDCGKVPYFACGYGVPKGIRVENPVGLVDIAPTFLTAAGVDVPNELDGVPLQRYFADPKHGDDRVVYTHSPRKFDMVKIGKLKYFRHTELGDEIMFDLKTDPGELKNIASDPKRKADLERLRKEMDKVLARPPVKMQHFDAKSRPVS